MSWIDLTLGGRKIRVAVVRTADGVWIGWPGRSKFFAPERSARSAPASVERELRAPMTGRVAELKATPGAKVKAGEVLVVLEAMKMEYRLTAGRDAAVESVSCKEGERVDLGQVLVRLAP